jgi:small subunit ribosomal protein S1
MVHIGDLVADKRVNHPQEVVKPGQTVKAVVLEADVERRRLRLGMKQLIPTSLDEYIAEHKEGDLVTGRISEVSGGRARVELGEGVHGGWRMNEAEPKSTSEPAAAQESKQESKTDLSSLSSMLAAKWKGGQKGESKPEPARAGQIRSFRISKLDAGGKRIELELV